MNKPDDADFVPMQNLVPFTFGEVALVASSAIKVPSDDKPTAWILVGWEANPGVHPADFEVDAILCAAATVAAAHLEPGEGPRALVHMIQLLSTILASNAAARAGQTPTTPLH